MPFSLQEVYFREKEIECQQCCVYERRLDNPSDSLINLWMNHTAMLFSLRFQLSPYEFCYPGIYVLIKYELTKATVNYYFTYILKLLVRVVVCWVLWSINYLIKHLLPTLVVYLTCFYYKLISYGQIGAYVISNTEFYRPDTDQQTTWARTNCLCSPSGAGVGSHVTPFIR